MSSFGIDKSCKAISPQVELWSSAREFGLLQGDPAGHAASLASSELVTSQVILVGGVCQKFSSRTAELYVPSLNVFPWLPFLNRLGGIPGSFQGVWAELDMLLSAKGVMLPTSADFGETLSRPHSCTFGFSETADSL